MSRLGPRKISSDQTTTPAAVVPTDLTLLDSYTTATLPTELGAIAVASDGLGGVWVGDGATTHRLYQTGDEVNGIANVMDPDYGAMGDGVTDDTAAFNAAIATGKAVFVPAGTFLLSALNEITAPCTLFGIGRQSKLVFNTALDAIVLHPAISLQRETYYLHDLAFDNLTNVPASFLRNRGAINLRLDRLYFSDCAATFCIDNEWGYGLKVADCVFSDVTGSGIRLQDDGVGGTKYSYDVTLANNDFTRVSLDAITIDGTTNLNIFGGVIETCRYGLWTNYRVASQIASVQSWGINLQGVYFETNTTDILCETSVLYSSRITMTACHMVGTPTIDLGAYGRLVAVGMQLGGTNECTVIGEADARVTLVGHVNHNFVQSGTFQWNDLGQYYDTVSTPTWSSSGTQPVLNNGTLTSHWSRNGNRATLTIDLLTGAATTYGTGTYFFSDPFLTLVPCTYPKEAVGSVMMYDASGAYRVGVAYMDVPVYGQAVAVAMDGVGAAGYLTATNPWTWDAGDWIRLSITYQC